MSSPEKTRLLVNSNQGIDKQLRPLDYRYRDLADMLRTAQIFNRDPSPLKGEYYRKQFQDFTDSVSSVPGFRGVFGTGYPFYANLPDNSIAHIEEIDRYIGTYERVARKKSIQDIGIWACTTCQSENQLPDLKKFCRPCDKVAVKPRDMFKTLPDLDFWVIVNDVSPIGLQYIQQGIQRAGFFPSDPNIGAALKDTEGVMNSILQGQPTDLRLPIDVHVISVDDMSEALARVRHKVREVFTGHNPDDTFVPISPQSLHVIWEKPDEPYDFMKDYLLSFTPQDISAGIANEIAETNALIRECLSSQDIYDIVARHPKEARQLQSPEIRLLLSKRWFCE